ncbi:hypothetical protein PUMCH_004081 [Australozyma saopauloensis]|uniref:Ditrans,polycis-polyprenyl diphosphate synthase ((2E,6E)-farnesyl diphosphate specific) n=1 Tax=Australozyma saopauloensis TaxID=291208 RepID=A0AAX4HE93_9ASCO|nr:hypothetical protein PUMCH_004081 [[Candida] saopauloensis]
MYTGGLIHSWGWFLNQFFYPVIMSRMCQIFLLVLKSGPVPKHVGFIMDGNRTFAKRHRLPPSDGHSLGAQTLQQVCVIFIEHTGRLLTEHRS